MTDGPLRVLFAASEGVPFSKTGGLADVVGALPKALKGLGCDVRVLLPLHRQTLRSDRRLDPCVDRMPVDAGGRWRDAGVLVSEMPGGVPCYLLARDDLYDRPHLYGPPEGEYGDNADRFIFLSKAAFALCQRIGFVPDVLHCHDWQTALVPAYQRHFFWQLEGFQRTRTVLTIHNLAYQGNYGLETFHQTGLPGSFLSPEGMEFWGQTSFLKGGIVSADRITTVSPTYSREILTGEFGCGLDGVLATRSADLVGILNGADYEDWDPSRDVHLPRTYDADTLEGKQACKRGLMEELGLSSDDEDAPFIGMISRLTSQKGVDLVLSGFDALMEMGARFVLLGDGEASYRSAFEQLAGRHPGRFRLRIDFDVPLSHRIQAGCDFLLMPSRFEPCGLNQIYALRYGTLPIVRATGGLKDTVTEADPQGGRGTGFRFEAYETGAMLEAVRRAVDLYRDPQALLGLRRNGMRQSFSWDRSARDYLKLYEDLHNLSS